MYYIYYFIYLYLYFELYCQNRKLLSTMETIISGAEDVLIDALSFKLGNSTSYITDRKSITFRPSGSNIYKTTSGTKVIKFQLNPEGWLDPSTVVINFNLVNNDATATKFVRPLQGGH